MELKILHFYPDLMSLYGSYANVSILKRTLEEMGASAIKSRKSSFFTHFRLSTRSASIKGTMAYPPPMVNNPIRKKMRNALK